VDYPASYEDDLIKDTTFIYDQANNRTSIIEDGTPLNYITNTLNQYEAVGAVSYEYDDNGNLTYDGTCFYDYDAENRLTEATNHTGAFTGPLNKALDCFDMEFTTGGSGTWALTTSVYCVDPDHDRDRDSAECEPVPVGDYSTIETTVYGPGTISFCFKAEDGTRLYFSVDNHHPSQSCIGIWQEELNYHIAGIGPHTVKWKFKKETGSSAGDQFWLDNVRWVSNNPAPSTELQQALDLDLDPDKNLLVYTDGDGDWRSTPYGTYFGDDAAQSGFLDVGETSQMEILVEGPGDLTFWWKCDCEYGAGDELQFLLDGQEMDSIDEDEPWHQMTYTVSGPGIHSCLWQFIQEDVVAGFGFVDLVEWSGSPPTQEPVTWETATYKYDPAGRRIEKDIDGDTTTYVYDGGNVIAEYDDGVLARKFVHGPRVDEVVCMINVADNNAIYYYHYDGSGSVVALSDSYGDSRQSYEYSAYGRVWASDPDFTANPYMFTGRRFDYKTGLYYYRARYYNPYIGRFLQTDPIGYGAGINWYAYCGNNPLTFIDPSGLADFFYDGRNGSVTELTGEWNYQGMGGQFNCDPCDISSLVCGEDTIYILDETADYIRYWPEEGVEVLMGTSDSSGLRETEIPANPEMGLWESIKIVLNNNAYLISGGWEFTVSGVNPWFENLNVEQAFGETYWRMPHPGGTHTSYHDRGEGEKGLDWSLNYQTFIILGPHKEEDFENPINVTSGSVSFLGVTIFTQDNSCWLGLGLGPSLSPLPFSYSESTRNP
jgi:RHS repeat-associated protein